VQYRLLCPIKPGYFYLLLFWLFKTGQDRFFSMGNSSSFKTGQFGESPVISSCSDLILTISKKIFAKRTMAIVSSYLSPWQVTVNLSSLNIAGGIGNAFSTSPKQSVNSRTFKPRRSSVLHSNIEKTYLGHVEEVFVQEVVHLGGAMESQRRFGQRPGTSSSEYHGTCSYDNSHAW